MKWIGWPVAVMAC